jgi:hypothetical protein
MNSDEDREILGNRVDHVIGAPRACLRPPLGARLAHDYRPWCAQLRDAQVQEADRPCPATRPCSGIRVRS